MKIIKCLVILMLAVYGLTACAPVQRAMDYSEVKSDVAMSQSIFLTPVGSDVPKTIFFSGRNTSSNQSVTTYLENTFLSLVQERGYQRVNDVSKASYVVQSNIRYSGEWKDNMDWQGTVGGAGVGALAGLGLSGGRSTSSMAAGSLIGAAIGFAADYATRLRTEVIVIDFRITERLGEAQDTLGIEEESTQVVTDTKVLGGFGSQTNLPTSQTTSRTVKSVKGFKVHSGAIAAKASQIQSKMDVEAVTRELVEKSAHQIAGIF